VRLCNIREKLLRGKKSDLELIWSRIVHLFPIKPPNCLDFAQLLPIFSFRRAYISGNLPLNASERFNPTTTTSIWLSTVNQLLERSIALRTKYAIAYTINVVGCSFISNSCLFRRHHRTRERAITEQEPCSHAVYADVTARDSSEDATAATTTFATL
jgi:hypothetical protein